MWMLWWISILLPLIKHYPLNVKLFYLSVFFLPLVDSVLELRVGAGWEIYIPLIFISFFITPQIFNYRISLVFILAVISVVTSGIVGLLLVDGNISENLRSQVHSPEAGIFVESIRFTASIMKKYLKQHWQFLYFQHL